MNDIENQSLINVGFFDANNQDHLEFLNLLDDLVGRLAICEDDLGGNYLWDSEIPDKKDFHKEIQELREHLIKEWKINI